MLKEPVRRRLHYHGNKLSSNLRMSVLNEVADNLSHKKELFAQMIAREGIKTINEASGFRVSGSRVKNLSFRKL